MLDHLGIDTAIVAGYSLGGAVAQEVWHRHPSRVDGLVLASTARNLRGHVGERMFFPVMTAAMHPLSRVALTKVERVAAALPDLPSVEVADGVDWGRAEFRSTSAWSMPEVLGELGRFHSAPWIGSIDVPTSVVVTGRDRAIPTRRQRKLAAAIPDVSVYDAPGGHALVVLDHERWAPVFLEAVADVTGRVPARRLAGERPESEVHGHWACSECVHRQAAERRQTGRLPSDANAARCVLSCARSAHGLLTQDTSTRDRSACPAARGTPCGC